VSFIAKDLLQRLRELESLAAPPKRYLVALSGGLDSTVLAHALASTRQLHGKAVIAIHVDHRLQDESRVWAKHCEQFATKLGLEFLCDVVDVDVLGGDGPEAAARDARYMALAKHVADGDWLLSAHHQDDQAETLMLNLLRGSGPAGLAGMRSMRQFSRGWLGRPLLGVSRDDLIAYATREELVWIDDPSNESVDFDRNFLRNEVLPLIIGRWPGAVARIARSAELARDASNLLSELAELDITSLGGDCDRLSITGLHTLSTSRQLNLLRHAAKLSGLPVPATPQLLAIVEQLLPAREDAEPLVSWPGGEARRYRDSLFLQPTFSAADFAEGQPFGDGEVLIGPGLGTLALGSGDGPGLSETVVSQGLCLRRREGGEEIQLPGQAHTRKLKKLLQEEGILPWLRQQLPLIYSGGQLVAVADLWISADALAEKGRAIHWRDKPDLY
jgi:tRNA(Ile)-lysidine synthase